ncbi:MAG: VOC family protein [Bacteroidaceae bacterium]|nr:VOC family protein [Bacteroidaceae bacterium]
MKLNRVHHVAVLCSDYERSLTFYRDVLGLQVLSEHYRAERQSYKTDLALNGVFVVELFSFPNPPQRLTNPEAAGLRHLAFEVDDVDAARSEVMEKGVPCEQVRIDSLSGKKFVFCFDPDNLPIEFYEKA